MTAGSTTPKTDPLLHDGVAGIRSLRPEILGGNGGPILGTSLPEPLNHRIGLRDVRRTPDRVPGRRLKLVGAARGAGSSSVGGTK